MPTEYLDRGIYSSGQAPANDSVGDVVGIYAGASDGDDNDWRGR